METQSLPPTRVNSSVLVVFIISITGWWMKWACLPQQVWLLHLHLSRYDCWRIDHVISGVGMRLSATADVKVASLVPSFLVKVEYLLPLQRVRKLINWFNWLIDWLIEIDWLVDWLIDWLIDFNWFINLSTESTVMNLLYYVIAQFHVQ